MTDASDARIEVALGDHGDARPGDLTMTLQPSAPHVLGCRCCGGRDPLASDLAAAFVARARGDLPWFDRVLLSGSAGQAGRVADVLHADPVTRARFRLQNSGM